MCLYIKWHVYASVYSIKHYMIYVYHKYYYILLYISIILKVIMWSNDALYDLYGITCLYWTISLSTVIKSFILVY